MTLFLFCIHYCETVVAQSIDEKLTTSIQLEIGMVKLLTEFSHIHNTVEHLVRAGRYTVEQFLSKPVGLWDLRTRRGAFESN